MKTLTGLNAVKRILDPIHGPIPLTPIEIDVISTPVFQRLRNITQLSMASLVFPGATHNRFQHCLGTMQVIDKLLYTLKMEEYLPKEEETKDRIIQILRISALLHDCGHLPFSHTFENLYLKGAHEEFGRCIIERSSISNYLEKNGIQPATIGNLVTGNAPMKDPNVKELTELIPLLHSNADADRMDYLLRDAYYTGVPYGRIDINRICNHVSLFEGRICFHEKVQDALEDFLFSRYQMYKIVYIHKTVIGYELILQKLYALIKKYSNEYELPFILPEYFQYKESNKQWFDDELYSLNERCLFGSVEELINQDIEEKDKVSLINFYSRIKKRRPIKNCYYHDNLAEIKESEYCDKEKSFYETLEQDHPDIVDHWSFLRYDPSNPINIASPIDKGIEDPQDPKQIRILKQQNNSQWEIKLMQEKSNSFLQYIAKHHRVLISYYHEDKNSQEIIQKLANDRINQVK